MSPPLATTPSLPPASSITDVVSVTFFFLSAVFPISGTSEHFHEQLLLGLSQNLFLERDRNSGQLTQEKGIEVYGSLPQMERECLLGMTAQGVRHPTQDTQEDAYSSLSSVSPLHCSLHPVLHTESVLVSFTASYDGCIVTQGIFIFVSQAPAKIPKGSHW